VFESIYWLIPDFEGTINPVLWYIQEEELSCPRLSAEWVRWLVVLLSIEVSFHS